MITLATLIRALNHVADKQHGQFPFVYRVRLKTWRRLRDELCDLQRRPRHPLNDPKVIISYSVRGVPILPFELERS